MKVFFPPRAVEVIIRAAHLSLADGAVDLHRARAVASGRNCRRATFAGKSCSFTSPSGSRCSHCSLCGSSSARAGRPCLCGAAGRAVHAAAGGHLPLYALMIAMPVTAICCQRGDHECRCSACSRSRSSPRTRVSEAAARPITFRVCDRRVSSCISSRSSGTPGQARHGAHPHVAALAHRREGVPGGGPQARCSPGDGGHDIIRLKHAGREVAMAQGLTARIVGLAGTDPLFARIRQEAEEAMRREPELATFLMTTILNHQTLESAVAYRVAARLDNADVSAALIRQTFDGGDRPRPVDRRGVPRRHHGGRRPRSRVPPDDGAVALFQRLPGASGLPAVALAA